MCTMSIDRYFTIQFPLKYGRNKTQKFMLFKISIVWLISIVIGSLMFLLGTINQYNVYDSMQKVCALNNSNFKLYGSVFAFFIPLFIIIITYIFTMFALQKLTKSKEIIFNTCLVKKFEKEFETYEAGKSIDALQSTKTKILTSSFMKMKRQNEEKSDAFLYDEKLPLSYFLRRKNNKFKRKKNASNESLPMQSFNLITKDTSTQMVASSNNQYSFEADAMSKLKSEIKIFKQSNENVAPSRKSPTKNRKISFPLYTNKLNGRKSLSNIYHMRSSISYRADNERKAQKVLIIMFFIFVILWTPFFTANILSAVCDACDSLINSSIFFVLTWLGYFSSMANPIIYTMFNKNFRNAFRNLLNCKTTKRNLIHKYNIRKSFQTV